MRLMTILNSKGEACFLEKTSDANLSPIVSLSIIQHARDISQRKMMNPGKTIGELLSETEMIRIRNQILMGIQELGVIHHDWTSKGIRYNDIKRSENRSLRSDRKEEKHHDYPTMPDQGSNCVDLDQFKILIIARVLLVRPGKLRLAIGMDLRQKKIGIHGVYSMFDTPSTLKENILEKSGADTDYRITMLNIIQNWT